MSTGYVKDIVYCTPASDNSLLTENIQFVILIVTLQMLNTWQEIDYILKIPCITNGDHIDLH